MKLVWSTPQGPVELTIPEGLSDAEFADAREAVNLVLSRVERRIQAIDKKGEAEYASWFSASLKEKP